MYEAVLVWTHAMELFIVTFSIGVIGCWSGWKMQITKISLLPQILHWQWSDDRSGRLGDVSVWSGDRARRLMDHTKVRLHRPFQLWFTVITHHRITFMFLTHYRSIICLYELKWLLGLKVANPDSRMEKFIRIVFVFILRLCSYCCACSKWPWVSLLLQV